MHSQTFNQVKEKNEIILGIEKLKIFLPYALRKLINRTVYKSERIQDRKYMDTKKQRN